VEHLPSRFPHLAQDGFGRNAAIHHRHPPRSSVGLSMCSRNGRSVLCSDVLPSITSYASGNPSGVTTSPITTFQVTLPTQLRQYLLKMHPAATSCLQARKRFTQRGEVIGRR